MHRFAHGKLRLCLVSGMSWDKGEDVPETTAFQASDQDLDTLVVAETSDYL